MIFDAVNDAVSLTDKNMVYKKISNVAGYEI